MISEYLYISGHCYTTSEIKAIIIPHVPGDNDEILLGNKELWSTSAAREVKWIWGWWEHPCFWHCVSCHRDEAVSWSTSFYCILILHFFIVVSFLPSNISDPLHSALFLPPATYSLFHPTILNCNRSLIIQWETVQLLSSISLSTDIALIITTSNSMLGISGGENVLYSLPANPILFCLIRFFFLHVFSWSKSSMFWLCTLLAEKQCLILKNIVLVSCVLLCHWS